MDSFKFITVRLGKDSISDINLISSSKVGVLEKPFVIKVKCTQIPENYKSGDYAFIWLGSDNNKGAQTKWKMGFKAVGKVIEIKRGASFNDTSETTLEICYIFKEAVNKMDVLRCAPYAYYWFGNFPVIGPDDHANQTIRLMSGEEFSDIRAFFKALENTAENFKEDIIKVEPAFAPYFDVSIPSPKYYPIAKSLAEVESNFTLEKNKIDKEPLLQIFYGAPGTDYIRSYLTALRTKPFMLLAGISGTGKSRIVRKLAQATTTQEYENEENRWKDNRPENFELIQVKPNWHNSMDVVGFYSNISRKYEFTPFVEFIVKAWQHKETPYFLCLDEMNLAPVEEYFAEFLSAIESRSTDEKGDYITDPIIKPFKNFGEKEGKSMLIQLLGDADPIDKNPIAVHFYEKGLTLPPNLMVMGTVNMDETTFSFSRKVLDRAMSVEMNEVDYDKFLSGESERFPLLTDMNELLVNRPQRAAEVTEEIESDMVIAYLKDVNTLMEGTPFKLGYRAANEAMLYVAACKKFAGSGYALANALDEFTLMKILSRIEGDDSRLGIADDDPRIATLGIEASEQHTSLLTCLKAIVYKHIGASSETEKKIDQMCNTLEREHFVSYWA